MATTYTLINSNVLASSAASVTFSAIPATYTDLVLRISARDSSNGSVIVAVNTTYNGLSTSIYSNTYLRGNGSAASSSRVSNNVSYDIDYMNGSTSTANTFGSAEMYIPSYTVSQSKPISTFTAQENNNTQGFITGIAGLYRDNAAITSITIAAATTFASTSSFYLYGISNA